VTPALEITMNSASFSKRGELTTTTILLGMAVLAWTLTVYQSHTMTCGMCSGMSVACPMCMGTGKPLFISLLLFLGMWATMMAAMMLPSLTPMVLLFRRIAHQRRSGGQTWVGTWVFTCGYLTSWVLLGFAAFAITRLVQWGLGAIPGISRYNETVAGLTLIVAGIYQLSPFKESCLRHCQTPLHFVLHGWREGSWGALRMGTSHGFYCIGCCWGLMIVLFAVGLMNLGWMAALTLVMSLEKMSQRGKLIGHVAGLFLVAAGLLLAFKTGSLHGLVWQL